MRAWCFGLMTLLAVLLVPGFAQAQAGPANIDAQLVAESERPAAGATVTLAFVMKPKPGWHGYWKNPGDAGMETQLHWTLPDGVTAGPLQYPVPETLLIAGLMNYVYEGDYTQFVTLTLPPTLAVGTPLPIRVKMDWLECTREICVPASANLTLNLTVGDGVVDTVHRAEFDTWRARMPKPLGGQASFASGNGTLRIGVPLPAAAEIADPYFFPLTDGAIDYAAPQKVSRDGDRLIIETKARDGVAGLASIEGVLKIADHGGLTVVARPGAVASGGTPVGAKAASGATTILLALGGAILGGLLLNIMPCVFPILSLKALSLAKAGVNENTARREGVAYTAGVVLVCVALGGILLALRAGGVAAGWAFQLQDPHVITLLLLLVVAIAFNLAGLFEIGSVAIGNRLTASGGTAGAFWTGALAAFIATPCTGPFMGAALGAALVLPTAAAIAIFAGLGLGLALPFLLLGFIPALRRRLPKPGPWMERFRRILAIPMFLTALGLAWILGRQAGVDGMTLGLVAALGLAVALWWVGNRQTAGGARSWIVLVPALALAAAVMIVMPRAGAEAMPTAGGGLLASEPFTESRLAALTAEGRPVFVYFTADWCLTCKVNEKAAIERADVAKAFKAHNVAVLVGDWTNGDPAIGRFIERHGRSGVPLYLYYAPGGREPEILPQVLTVDRLTGLAG